MTARLLVAVLLALAAVFVLPAPAYACGCQRTTEAEQAAAADVVFTGTLIDDQQGEPRTLTFTVDRVYKGSATTTQIVATAGTVAGCGVQVDGAGPYVVYAEQGRSGLEAGLCGGTRTGPAPASLGVGQPPAADPRRPGPDNRAGFWVPLVGLLLAASAAGLVGFTLVRRRPG